MRLVAVAAKQVGTGVDIGVGEVYGRLVRTPLSIAACQGGEGGRVRQIAMTAGVDAETFGFLVGCSAVVKHQVGKATLLQGAVIVTGDPVDALIELLLESGDMTAQAVVTGLGVQSNQHSVGVSDSIAILVRCRLAGLGCVGVVIAGHRRVADRTAETRLLMPAPEPGTSGHNHHYDDNSDGYPPSGILGAFRTELFARPFLIR